MTKSRRVIVRLKHSLPEGTEIHSVLPDSLEEIERIEREVLGPGDQPGEDETEQ